jgi:clan AA aspartic protease
MIQGTVDEFGHPEIEINVHGPTGRSLVITAMIDTGFDRYLSLSRSAIDDLMLNPIGESKAFLADGTSTVMRMFDAQVSWHGQLIAVEVHEADGVPLVGMNLLHGSRLTIDVIDRGKVVIEPLPT